MQYVESVKFLKVLHQLSDILNNRKEFNLVKKINNNILSLSPEDKFAITVK
jgi:hypothetical protein